MTEQPFFYSDKSLQSITEEEMLNGKVDRFDSTFIPSSTLCNMRLKEDTAPKTIEKGAKEAPKVVFLSKKRRKTKKEYSRLYRHQEKLQETSLKALKRDLEDSISLLLTQPLSNIFRNIPLSLMEFKDILLPSNISFNTINNCHDYIAHLETQRQTLIDIFNFNEESSSASAFPKQFQLYNCINIHISFAKNIAEYMTFISEIHP